MHDDGKQSIGPLRRAGYTMNTAAAQERPVDRRQPVVAAPTVRRATATRALLVSPRFPVTYWGFQTTMRLIGKSATLPPLGLLTVAALLPADWDIRLVDLNVETLDDAALRWAEVVLTGGMLIQVASMQEVIARAVALGRRVVVGGPAATTSPELFGDADVVFQGEAEGRIDELLEALAARAGVSRRLAAPKDFPEMTSVPVPRFDLLDLRKYATVSVQYSRGCPFQCEFCDVIEIFGRKPRVKEPAQVLREFEYPLHGPRRASSPCAWSSARP